MKVALYIPLLAGGGSERVTLNLAKGLSELGVCVGLIVAQSGGQLEDQIPEGVDTIFLNAANTGRRALGLANYVDRHNVDIIHSSLFRGAPVVALASKLCKSDVRTAVEVENPLTFVYRSLSPGKKLLRKILLGVSFYSLDRVLPVSNDVAKDLAHFTHVSESKVKPSPNPIHVQNHMSQNESTTKVSSSSLIVSTGRLTPQKDFPTLIKAIHIVSQKEDVRLVILGEGEERDKLLDLVARLDLDNIVSLPGFVQCPEEYFSKADIFALSSRYEGFGNVLVEAMAMGVPIVSTDCIGGPSEILSQGEYGELVPVADPSEMAKAILNTLKKEIDSERLRSRARDFNIRHVARRYYKLFDQMVLCESN